ncbi:MAG: hypothetical protein V1648_02155 [Candidatus Aenigmatarchaeota archaeon]
MLTAGKGKYKVWLKEARQGKDVILFLGGGERTHIGSVVVCAPGKPAKVLNRKGHYDWMVAIPIAEKKSRKTKKAVVCIAGIHVNNASKKEIEILKKNCKAIENKI